MKKQHDWMDYVNLAANVSQAAQLSELKKTNLAQTKAAEIEIKKAEIENGLRSMVFDWETKLDDAKAHLRTRPTHTYFVAELISTAVRRGRIEPDHFSQFADKDRFQCFLRALDECVQESRALISDVDFEKYSEYSSYAHEHEVLDHAIRKNVTLKSASERQKAVSAEIAGLTARQAQLKGSVTYVPLIVGAVCGIGILAVYASKAFGTIVDPKLGSKAANLLWMFSGAGAIALGGIVFYFISGKASVELLTISERLKKMTDEAGRLKGMLNDPTVKQIPQHFLNASTEELKAMKSEREKLMAQWLEAPQ